MKINKLGYLIQQDYLVLIGVFSKLTGKGSEGAKLPKIDYL